MSGTEEQLVSFFLYSWFIYPVTNYLVSSARTYPRWKGACYAIFFMALISAAHMMYENREKGPNHYNLLGISRGTSTANLKRAYRNLSLELHPDKNKSPTAPEEFRKVKHAFDVLLNPDTRQVYERLGDAGVKVAAQSVIDHKYIIIQMMVYYSSSMIFAFLMTFAESSGDAMVTSLFGLIVMLLIECALVLEQVQIPVWVMPHHTAHDVVSLLRRLYPAFMNGCRCIIGAFVVDHKACRVEALIELNEATRLITQKASALVQSTVLTVQHIIVYGQTMGTSSSGRDSSGTEDASNGATLSMADALRQLQNMLTRSDSIVVAVKERTAMVQNQTLLRSKEESSASNFSWARDICIYLLLRFVLAFRSKLTPPTSGKKSS